MPNYEQSFAIRQLLLGNAAFTDVQGLAVLPIDCNQVIIFNNSNVEVTLATNPNLTSSEVVLEPGQYFPIGTPSREGGFRFPQNCPAVCSLKAASGTPTVIIESLK
jgi:hypothetical protein